MKPRISHFNLRSEKIILQLLYCPSSLLNLLLDSIFLKSLASTKSIRLLALACKMSNLT